MNNKSDKSVPPGKSAEGNPESCLSVDLMKIKKEPSSDWYSADERDESEQSSPSQQTYPEVRLGRMRASSFIPDFDYKRVSFINAHYTSKDKVCVWNDQTGQSVVVASNQSTRDALNSLSMRDSEAERMEIATKISYKRIEDRTPQEKETLRQYHEEYASKQLAMKARNEPLCITPPPVPPPPTRRTRKRIAKVQQTFIDPANMTSEEAQAMFYTYLNYTQQNKEKVHTFLTEDHQLKPFIHQLKKKAMSETKPPILAPTPINRSTSATATAIVMESSKPVLPPKRPYNRSYFGISRFLDFSSSESSSSSSSPMAGNISKERDFGRVIATNGLQSLPISDQSKNSHMTQRGVNLGSSLNNIATPAALVINDVSLPIPPGTVQRAVVFNVDRPMKIEPRQMAVPVRPSLVDQAHKLETSPVLRSKSTPIVRKDEDLIAFLREPLALAKAAEEAARKKKNTEPKKPKRKSRPKKVVDRRTQPRSDSMVTVNLKKVVSMIKAAKTPRSKSTPSSLSAELRRMKAQNSISSDHVDNPPLKNPPTDYNPVKGSPSIRGIIRLDMSLGQAIHQVPLGAVAGQLRVQKALYEKMEPFNGVQPEFAQKTPEMAPTTVGQNLIGEVPTVPEPASVPEKKPPPKRKRPTKAEREAAGMIPAEEKPKKQKAPKPSKKKPAAEAAAGVVEHHMGPANLQYPEHAVFQPPIQQPAYQPLPSIANLLPLLNNNHNQQPPPPPPPQQQRQNGAMHDNMMGGYGFTDAQPGSSSSSSSMYSPFNNYAMNGPQNQNQAEKHPSLASMLKPLSCSSKFAQKETTNNNLNQRYPDNQRMYQQQANQFSNLNQPYPPQAAIYPGQSTSNEYYSGYETAAIKHYPSTTDFPPHSVESRQSCPSRDSNAPNSHNSSMPQTPISQQSNNGSLLNTMPVTHDNQFSNANGHILIDDPSSGFDMEQYAKDYGLFGPENVTTDVHHEFKLISDVQVEGFFSASLEKEDATNQASGTSSPNSNNLNSLGSAVSTPSDFLGHFSDSGPSTHQTHREQSVGAEMNSQQANTEPQVISERHPSQDPPQANGSVPTTVNPQGVSGRISSEEKQEKSYAEVKYVPSVPKVPSFHAPSQPPPQNQRVHSAPPPEYYGGHDNMQMPQHANNANHAPPPGYFDNQGNTQMSSHDRSEQARHHKGQMMQPPPGFQQTPNNRVNSAPPFESSGVQNNVQMQHGGFQPVVFQNQDNAQMPAHDQPGGSSNNAPPPRYSESQNEMMQSHARPQEPQSHRRNSALPPPYFVDPNNGPLESGGTQQPERTTVNSAPPPGSSSYTHVAEIVKSARSQQPPNMQDGQRRLSSGVGDQPSAQEPSNYTIQNSPLPVYSVKQVHEQMTLQVVPQEPVTNTGNQAQHPGNQEIMEVQQRADIQDPSHYRVHSAPPPGYSIDQDNVQMQGQEPPKSAPPLQRSDDLDIVIMQTNHTEIRRTSLGENGQKKTPVKRQSTAPMPISNASARAVQIGPSQQHRDLSAHSMLQSESRYNPNEPVGQVLKQQQRFRPDAAGTFPHPSPQPIYSIPSGRFREHVGRTEHVEYVERYEHPERVAFEEPPLQLPDNFLDGITNNTSNCAETIDEVINTMLSSVKTADAQKKSSKVEPSPSRSSSKTPSKKKDGRTSTDVQTGYQMESSHHQANYQRVQEQLQQQHKYVVQESLKPAGTTKRRYNKKREPVQQDYQQPNQVPNMTNGTQINQNGQSSSSQPLYHPEASVEYVQQHGQRVTINLNPQVQPQNFEAFSQNPIPAPKPAARKKKPPKQPVQHESLLESLFQPVEAQQGQNQHVQQNQQKFVAGQHVQQQQQQRQNQYPEIEQILNQRPQGRPIEMNDAPHHNPPVEYQNVQNKNAQISYVEQEPVQQNQAEYQQQLSSQPGNAQQHQFAQPQLPVKQTKPRRPSKPTSTAQKNLHLKAQAFIDQANAMAERELETQQARQQTLQLQQEYQKQAQQLQQNQQMAQNSVHNQEQQPMQKIQIQNPQQQPVEMQYHQPQQHHQVQHHQVQENPMQKNSVEQQHQVPQHHVPQHQVQQQQVPQQQIQHHQVQQQHNPGQYQQPTQQNQESMMQYQQPQQHNQRHQQSHQFQQQQQAQVHHQPLQNIQHPSQYHQQQNGQPSQAVNQMQSPQPNSDVLNGAGQPPGSQNGARQIPPPRPPLPAARCQKLQELLQRPVPRLNVQPQQSYPPMQQHQRIIEPERQQPVQQQPIQYQQTQTQQIHHQQMQHQQDQHQPVRPQPVQQHSVQHQPLQHQPQMAHQQLQQQSNTIAATIASVSSQPPPLPQKSKSRRSHKKRVETGSQESADHIVRIIKESMKQQEQSASTQQPTKVVEKVPAKAPPKQVKVPAKATEHIIETVENVAKNGPNDSLPPPPLISTITPLMRSKRFRETVAEIAALPSFTMEEYFQDGHGIPCEDNYIEFCVKVTQEMEDNPCPAEIGVEDALADPELEPALHGRFRKRMIALREGRTESTVFKKRKCHSTDVAPVAKKQKVTEKNSDAAAIVSSTPLSVQSQDGNSLDGHLFHNVAQPMSGATASNSMSSSSSINQIATGSQQQGTPFYAQVVPSSSTTNTHQPQHTDIYSKVSNASKPPTSSVPPVSPDYFIDQYDNTNKYMSDLIDSNAPQSPILINDPIMGYANSEKQDIMTVFNETDNGPGPSFRLSDHRSIFDTTDDFGLGPNMNSIGHNNGDRSSHVGTLEDIDNSVDTFYIGGSPYSPLDPNVNIPMQNVSDDRSLSPDLSVPSQLVASSVFDSVVFNDDSDDIDGQGSSNDMFGNDSNNTNSIDAWSSKGWIPIV